MTGVQTCALPISRSTQHQLRASASHRGRSEAPGPPSTHSEHESSQQGHMSYNPHSRQSGCAHTGTSRAGGRLETQPVPRPSSLCRWTAGQVGRGQHPWKHPKDFSGSIILDDRVSDFPQMDRGQLLKQWATEPGRSGLRQARAKLCWCSSRRHFSLRVAQIS